MPNEKTPCRFCRKMLSPSGLKYHEAKACPQRPGVNGGRPVEASLPVKRSSSPITRSRRPAEIVLQAIQHEPSFVTGIRKLEGACKTILDLLGSPALDVSA